MRTKQGRFALWKIATKDGCPMPTVEGILTKIRDPRPMVILAVRVTFEQRLHGDQPNGASALILPKEVKTIGTATVRWGGANICPAVLCELDRVHRVRGFAMDGNGVVGASWMSGPKPRIAYDDGGVPPE